MGLDITVYKIVRKKDAVDKYDYFSLVDDNGNYENKFPEWTKKFECTRTENWYDYDKFKELTGIDINNLECIMQEYNGKNSYMEVIDKEFAKTEPKYVRDGDNTEWENWMDERDKKAFKIYFKDIPTYKKKIKILYKNEVGYQRKGLNSKFYEDYDAGKIGYYVWDKKELERYMNDYCDDDHPSEYDRHYICTPKVDFKENIIDNFTEGECCVTFDW